VHTHAPFVLALEPDLRQASVLKRVIRDRVHAELMVVDSRDAAIAATSTRIPDVILLTALLSPRDEAELIAHLRGLSGAEHVQTHTIPQLASSTHDSDGGQEQGGLFGKLRRKKSADQAFPGCDPTAFADEVGTFIARAAEMKAQAALMPPPPIIQPIGDRRAQEHHATAGQGAETASEEPADVESAWSSPFEWRRPDPAAQKNGQKKEAAPPRRPLVKNAPLAVIAEEEEARRAEAARRTHDEAQERQRVEAEAAATRERERLEADAAAQRERERVEAAAAAKRQRERLEAEAAAKRERERLEAEAAAKRERERLEAEAAAKRERLRLEAEAAAKRERERLEAESAVKRERQRREAEAAAKRERERLEAEAAAKRERERREAEAAAKRERERREAEAATKRERERLEAEAAAKRERERLEAEAAAKRERERLEAEAAAERERVRVAAEAAEQERVRQEAEARARREADDDVELEIDLDHDPFADFRSEGQAQARALLNLMPVTAWARVGDGKRQASESARTDDVQDLMAGLSIPPHVAAVAYARGCRIRRVRVPAPRPAARTRMSRPVILSKRALAEARNDQQSGA